MCGVDQSVLIRAADVLALQQAGQPVGRLQLPQLEQRDEQYWQLIRQLAGVDINNTEGMARLLQRMLEVDTGTYPD